MKKHLRNKILGCIVLLYLLTGCHANEPIETSASIPPTGSTANTPTISDAIQSDPLETEHIKAAEDGLLSRQDIQRIYYGPTGTLLISTPDTLYWYDAGQDEILAQRPADNWLEAAFYSAGDTLCAIVTAAAGESAGGFTSSLSTDTMCIFFDGMLQEAETFNLSDLEENGNYIRCTAVSSDGNKIAYATLDKLCYYDRASNTLSLVLDLSYENIADNRGLSSISSIVFDPSESRLLFCGSSFTLPLTEGQNSYVTYGCIYLDGTGLQNLPFQGFEAGSLAGSAGGYLIFEESMKSPSGKLAVVNGEDMSQQVYSLGSVKEGTSGLFCSQDGGFYATEEVGANSITLQIYDRVTGQLACTRIFEDANAEYFYRPPAIYIIDSQELCIVKLGGFNEIPSKVVTFSLSRG